MSPKTFSRLPAEEVDRAPTTRITPWGLPAVLLAASGGRQETERGRVPIVPLNEGWFPAMPASTDTLDNITIGVTERQLDILCEALELADLTTDLDATPAEWKDLYEKLLAIGTERCSGDDD